MKNRKEMLISMVQVGADLSATEWLKGLGKSLLDAGAKFDIVDTVTSDQ